MKFKITSYAILTMVLSLTLKAQSRSSILPTSPAKITEIVVSTLAGSTTKGYADGTGIAAKFANPTQLAVDASGTVYVADWANSRIRKITPSGVVTTFAGSGTPGFADGIGTSAQLNFPIGVAVDASGTVYVADTDNNRIRKITSAGVVTTLAGSGTVGSADGTGTTAQFSAPFSLTVDASGTVYVADTENHIIRVITPSGVVSTLAGTGTPGFADGAGTAAQFYYPKDVAVDASGTVYVADYFNSRIRAITPSGMVSTFAGTGTAGFADGTDTSAQFNFLSGVAVDASGTVYVADSGNRRIRTITAGVVSTLAGSGTFGSADGTGTTAQFNTPDGVAVDASGTVYVADRNNNNIRKIISSNSSLGIEDNIIKGFAMYPNPVKDSFKITAQEQINEVEIYNLLGQLLKYKAVNNSETTVSTAKLPAGTYFAKIRTDKTLKSVKFIKE